MFKNIHRILNKESGFIQNLGAGKAKSERTRSGGHVQGNHTTNIAPTETCTIWIITLSIGGVHITYCRFGTGKSMGHAIKNLLFWMIVAQVRRPQSCRIVRCNTIAVVDLCGSIMRCFLALAIFLCYWSSMLYDTTYFFQMSLSAYFPPKDDSA